MEWKIYRTNIVIHIFGEIEGLAFRLLLEISSYSSTQASFFSVLNCLYMKESNYT